MDEICSEMLKAVWILWGFVTVTLDWDTTTVSGMFSGQPMIAICCPTLNLIPRGWKIVASLLLNARFTFVWNHGYS